MRRLLTVPVLITSLLVSGCAAAVSGSAAPVASPDLSRSSSGTALTTGPASAGTASAAPSTNSASQPTSDSSTESATAPASTAPASTAPASTAPASTAPASATAGSGMDPADFGARMAGANASVKSLVGSISISAGTTVVDGTFSETMAGGKVSAMNMAMFIKAGGQDVALKMLIVDGKIYLGGSEILSSLDAGDKMWALASKTSSKAALRTFAAELGGYLDSASANRYAMYGQAASSIVDEGAVKLGAIAAHKYGVTVDVKKLIGLDTGLSKESMQAILDAGVTTIPSTIWLDSSDHLVQVTSTVTVAAITSSTIFRVSGYNTGVVIKAPPANEVYTG